MNNASAARTFQLEPIGAAARKAAATVTIEEHATVCFKTPEGNREILMPEDSITTGDHLATESRQPLYLRVGPGLNVRLNSRRSAGRWFPVVEVSVPDNQAPLADELNEIAATPVPTARAEETLHFALAPEDRRRLELPPDLFAPVSNQYALL